MGWCSRGVAEMAARVDDPAPGLSSLACGSVFTTSNTTLKLWAKSRGPFPKISLAQSFEEAQQRLIEEGEKDGNQ